MKEEFKELQEFEELGCDRLPHGFQKLKRLLYRDLLQWKIHCHKPPDASRLHISYRHWAIAPSQMSPIELDLPFLQWTEQQSSNKTELLT